MKRLTGRLIDLAQQIGYEKGFEKGFDACKTMYNKYVILPKCYKCDKIGNGSYSHLYGTEPACNDHSSNKNDELTIFFPIKYI
mgnify:CR=1 FL=1